MKATPTKLKVGTIVDLDPLVLKFDKANRRVNGKHVSALKGSMSQQNLMPLNPLKVNENMTIIDGQHRVTAALELGWPIVTCQIVKATIRDAVQLNLHQRNWSAMDFANFWAENGKEEYRKYLEFVAVSNVQPSVALELMSDARQGFGRWDEFRQGRVKVHVEITALYEFLEKLEDFRKWLNHNRSRVFIRAFWRLYNSKDFKYDHERMIHKLTVVGQLNRTVETKGYLEQLEYVYNYRAKMEEKVRFVR